VETTKVNVRRDSIRFLEAVRHWAEGTTSLSAVSDALNVSYHWLYELLVMAGLAGTDGRIADGVQPQDVINYILTLGMREIARLVARGGKK